MFQKQWLTLFFLAYKIIADGDCSHEIKRHLLLGRKAMTNLDSKRRRGRQRMRLLDSITNSMEMSLGRLQQFVMGREAWHAAVHEVAKSQARLSDWTQLIIIHSIGSLQFSSVGQPCPTLSDLMDCSPPAPPSMGFSRQEYWSGVPLPSPIFKLLTLNWRK